METSSRRQTKSTYDDKRRKRITYSKRTYLIPLVLLLVIVIGGGSFAIYKFLNRKPVSPSSKGNLANNNEKQVSKQSGEGVSPKTTGLRGVAPKDDPAGGSEGKNKLSEEVDPKKDGVPKKDSGPKKDSVPNNGNKPEDTHIPKVNPPQSNPMDDDTGKDPQNGGEYPPPEHENSDPLTDDDAGKDPENGGDPPPQSEHTHPENSDNNFPTIYVEKIDPYYVNEMNIINFFENKCDSKSTDQYLGCSIKTCMASDGDTQEVYNNLYLLPQKADKVEELGYHIYELVKLGYIFNFIKTSTEKRDQLKQTWSLENKLMPETFKKWALCGDDDDINDVFGVMINEYLTINNDSNRVASLKNFLQKLLQITNKYEQSTEFFNSLSVNGSIMDRLVADLYGRIEVDETKHQHTYVRTHILPIISVFIDAGMEVVKDFTLAVIVHTHGVDNKLRSKLRISYNNLKKNKAKNSTIVEPQSEPNEHNESESTKNSNDKDESPDENVENNALSTIIEVEKVEDESIELSPEVNEEESVIHEETLFKELTIKEFELRLINIKVPDIISFCFDLFPAMYVKSYIKDNYPEIQTGLKSIKDQLHSMGIEFNESYEDWNDKKLYIKSKKVEKPKKEESVESNKKEESVESNKKEESVESDKKEKGTAVDLDLLYCQNKKNKDQKCDKIFKNLKNNLDNFEKYYTTYRKLVKDNVFLNSQIYNWETNVEDLSYAPRTVLMLPNEYKRSVLLNDANEIYIPPQFILSIKTDEDKISNFSTTLYWEIIALRYGFNLLNSFQEGSITCVQNYLHQTKEVFQPKFTITGESINEIGYTYNENISGVTVLNIYRLNKLTELFEKYLDLDSDILEKKKLFFTSIVNVVISSNMTFSNEIEEMEGLFEVNNNNESTEYPAALKEVNNNDGEDQGHGVDDKGQDGEERQDGEEVQGDTDKRQGGEKGHDDTTNDNECDNEENSGVVSMAEVIDLDPNTKINQYRLVILSAQLHHNRLFDNTYNINSNDICDVVEKTMETIEPSVETQ
eukprot:GHVR01164009.1.p1 GENE.GHVR01164009.1~~GHVR01164009.1.p1  ORF type:complete len:1025 (+),score=261.40 GHVR01164009.1:39-3113(+)